MAEIQSAPSLRDAFPARKGDWMQTFTGRRFWPLDPRSDDVSIEDIAHALSLLTRYGGHCMRFYSVAEHCVLLARAVPEEHRLWALLHDASEAYIADIVRPLKRHLDGYGAAEARVMAAVAEHFRLRGVEPPEVKAADSRILMDERAQVMRPTGDTWNYGGAREPLGITLQFWSPEQAEREFLALYSELTGYAVDLPPPTTLTEAVASARAEGRKEALSELASRAEGQLAHWRRQMADKKTMEDGVSEDGFSYTPIGDEAAWDGGYCNGRLSEADWWGWTIRALIPAPPTTPGGRTDG